MDKPFVSSSAVKVDKCGDWTHIRSSEIDVNRDDPDTLASTDKHAPSEVEGDFCVLHVPHPSEEDSGSTRKPNNQPSFFGRLWSSGSQLIGGNDNKPTLPPLDENTQHSMASIDDQEEQKAKTSRGFFGRIKNVWKSEDDKAEESVLHTVLKDNDELRKHNTSLIRRLSAQEKKAKNCKSELQKKKDEVQRTKQLPKQGSKSQTAPVVTHKQVQDKDSLRDETACLKEENRTLRESLNLVTQQCSLSETSNKHLRERIKHFEVECRVEKDDNDRLKNEIRQLQVQLESLVVVESKTGPSSRDNVETKGEDAVTCLEARSKQLFENVTKLQEHAKNQSRQILLLTDQMQGAEEKARSFEDLLQGAEEEREQIQTELTCITSPSNESDPAELHRGATTWRSTSTLPNQPSAIELQWRNTQLMSENAKLEEIMNSMIKGNPSLKDLWEKEKTIKDLTMGNQSMWNQVQTLSREKEELQSQLEDLTTGKQSVWTQAQTLSREEEELQGQLEALKFQLLSYKSDFEDERKDREAAHSKMADMQKKLELLELENATYHLEIDNLKKKSCTVKEVLHEKLEGATTELNKHKEVLADLEVVHQRHVHEARKVQDELHAKTIQVKQYAKENEKLKMQLATAMESISVLAGELEKDRQKCFELQRKLTKGTAKSTKESSKSRKSSVPDSSEAVEKRAAKLEQLYNESAQHIQVLMKENKELRDELLRSAHHDRKSREQGKFSKAGFQMPQPDGIVEDDGGTAGAGYFVVSMPSQQQQSPGQQTVDAPANRESSRASSEQPAVPCDTRSSTGMNLPLKESTNTARGSRSVGNTPSTPHKAWSPGHKRKDSPTVQGSSAKASGDLVSPMKRDGHTVQSKTTVLSPSSGSVGDAQSAIKSAPLFGYGGKVDSGATEDKQLSSFQAEQAKEGSQVPHQHELVVAQSDSNAESAAPCSPTSLPTVDDISRMKGDNIMHIQRKSQPPSLGRDIQLEAHVSSSTASAPLEPPVEPTTHRSHSSAPQNLQLNKDIQSGSMQQSRKKEVEQNLIEVSVNQFENPLQKRLDDEIHESAAEVIQEVSGGLEEVSQSSNRPYDPNLVCPMCMRRFRIGEIQFFKRHVNTCDGTDADLTSIDTDEGDRV